MLLLALDLAAGRSSDPFEEPERELFVNAPP